MKVKLNVDEQYSCTSFKNSKIKIKKNIEKAEQ